MAAVHALVVAPAEIRAGKLFLKNRREFNRTVAQLTDGWQVEVVVTRLQATRSGQANRYYWGVVIAALSLHTGYTPDELHELMKMKFLPKHLALADGNGEVKGEFVMGGSTRHLPIAEFYAYVEQVRQFAAEALDVYTPDPGEGWSGAL